MYSIKYSIMNHNWSLVTLMPDGPLYCCCRVFPCLHLLVVSSFPRISASVHQKRTADRRVDVFLPWLVVGAGPPKRLQSRSFGSIAAPIVGLYQRQSAYLNRWLPLSPMTWLAVCQQSCRGFGELVLSEL